METIHAEYISVTLYREMFEKMHKVISMDRDSTQLCAARCRAILNDLLKLLSATERRLTNNACGSTLETNSWLFHFEAMIAPLWASVQEVESGEDTDSLESRVIKASMIINACLPLMQSHHYVLDEALFASELADEHADHVDELLQVLEGETITSRFPLWERICQAAKIRMFSGHTI